MKARVFILTAAVILAVSACSTDLVLPSWDANFSGSISEDLPVGVEFFVVAPVTVVYLDEATFELSVDRPEVDTTWRWEALRSEGQPMYFQITPDEPSDDERFVVNRLWDGSVEQTYEDVITIMLTSEDFWQ